MNRNQILQEIGITSWVLKHSDSTQSLESLSAQLPIEQALSSPLSEHTMTSSNDQLPTWIIVASANAMQSPLFSKVTNTIRKFGVEVLTLEMLSNTLQTKDIKGDLVIGFGDAAAQFFSNEPSSAQELREIIFETTNEEGNEIPVVITHDIEALRNTPIKKRDLWNDLVMARSIYLEMH
jgi:hypothetical protein